MRIETAKTAINKLAGFFNRKLSGDAVAFYVGDFRFVDDDRTAFEEARTAAGIADLRLQDFRHTAITRWALMGIPQAAIMAAAGHHSIPQNLAYTNLQPSDVKNAFKLATQVQQGNALESASVASY